MLIKLKWIYKVKTDEFGGVLKNKARLVAQGFRQEESKRALRISRYKRLNYIAYLGVLYSNPLDASQLTRLWLSQFNKISPSTAMTKGRTKKYSLLTTLHQTLAKEKEFNSLDQKLRYETACPAKTLKTSDRGRKTSNVNGVVKRLNHTLVEAAQTMLSASKLPLFFWDEAIATTCYTQNQSLIIPKHEKTPYHIINERKPSLKHLYIFGFTCYLVRDGENLDKIKEKGDPCIFLGYSTTSKGYRVFNKRTRLLVESIHINFDEIKECSKVSDYDNSGPVPQLQMAFDHNCSELKIRNHNNEPSSLKLVSNDSSPADKTYSSQ
ncbi:retrovirus-related pol polyprotein from transposon TNT 1-94 [Tanacetum coccineum]